MAYNILNEKIGSIVNHNNKLYFIYDYYHYLILDENLEKMINKTIYNIIINIETVNQNYTFNSGEFEEIINLLYFKRLYNSDYSYNDFKNDIMNFYYFYAYNEIYNYFTPFIHENVMIKIWNDKFLYPSDNSYYYITTLLENQNITAYEAYENININIFNLCKIK